MSAFDLAMVGVQVALFARFLFVLGCALAQARRRGKDEPRPSGADGAGAVPVTVVVPAFDEERTLAATVRSIAASRHAPLDIVVVDDGSRDGTLEVARSLARELPNVTVRALGKNRGKVAALNEGVGAARGEVVATVDADTTLHPEALSRLVSRLVAGGAAAVASNVRVGNRDRWLTRWQSLEYVCALNLDRRAQALLGCITTVPGAAAVYRREALSRAGGFSADTATEDTDLSLLLLARGEKVLLEPEALAFTEAPSSARALFRQRRRWLYGNLQCAWKHRRWLFSARRPALGFFGLPNLWLVHLGVYLLLPFSAAFTVRLAHALDAPVLVGLFSALFLLDLALCAAAYGVERAGSRASPSDLLQAPVQRLLFPFFLWAVFLAVAARRLAGRAPRWT